MKFAPNNGQGGCTAIEDAAALANHIKKLNDLKLASDNLPDTALIEKRMQEFQDFRLPRIRPVDAESRLILRGDCLQGQVANFMVHYVVPNVPDFIETSWTRNMVNPVFLDYLPIPKHARTGTMPLNAKLGYGKTDHPAVRGLRALPLLLIFFSFYFLTGPRIEEARSKAASVSQAGFGSHGGSNCSLGILDFLTISYSAIIQNPISFNQLLVLWMDFVPMYSIWMIEGHRRGNILTFSQL